jgi:hypothetical protein
VGDSGEWGRGDSGDIGWDSRDSGAAVWTGTVRFVREAVVPVEL